MDVREFQRLIKEISARHAKTRAARARPDKTRQLPALVPQAKKIVQLLCPECGARNNVLIPFPRQKWPMCGACRYPLARECFVCKIALLGRPKIRMADGAYCYRCAKARVSYLMQKRQEAYSKSLTAYTDAHADFLIRHTQWSKSQKQDVESAYPFRTFGIGLCVISSLGTYVLKPGIWVYGLMAGFIVWFVMWKANRDERRKEFLNSNPPPKFDRTKPTEPWREVLDHYPFPADGSINRNRQYREEILSRDQHRCQSCEQPKAIGDLEVHHVIPVAQGGLDEPTNLVTLCKYCHDREEWYGHVRIYPTTC